MFQVNQRSLLSWILVVSIGLQAVLPNFAQADWIGASNLPTPTKSTFATAELVQRGCETVQPLLGRVSIPDGKQVYVQATDTASQHGYLFCPTTVNLTGQVAGIVNEADAQGIAGFCQNHPWLCAGIGGAGGAVVAGGAAAKWAGDKLKAFVINLIAWCEALVASVAIYVVILGSFLMGKLLSIGQFITNPFVRSLWPFVQGVANIGFIIALLFIAAMTALRLDIGGGIRRLLPRLLIAALLINFSLVIGGVLVDASRLLMAVEVRLVGNPGAAIDQVGLRIVENSDLIKSVFVINNNDPLFRFQPNQNTIAKQGWGYLATLTTAMVIIWALAVGIFVITFMLFVRYIALLLLLGISPLAYLSFAMPRAEGLGIAWWRNFLRYVFFGPAALAILILIPTIVGSAALKLFANPGNNVFQQSLNAAAGVTITIAMLMAAAKAGKMVGMYGADAVINGATKAGKRAAYYGSPAPAAKILGIGAYRRSRDFAQEATKPIRRGLGIGEFSKYDDQGKLKEGRKSIGSRAGGAVASGIEKVPGFRPPKTERERAKNIQSSTKNIRDNLGSQSTVQNIRPASLQSAEAAKNLTRGDVESLITNLASAGDTAKLDMVVSNTELVKHVKESDTAYNAILATGDKGIIKTFNQSIKTIVQQEEKGSA